MKKTILVFLLGFLLPIDLLAQFSFDIEGNYIASIRYNEVRIPSNGGSFFDLSKDLSPSTQFTFRLRASYTLNKKHVISALYAPLTIKSSGSVDRPIVYSDQRFDENTPLQAVYKFNSYRLTYRYLFVRKTNLILGAGLTAKVRDANIILKDGIKSADYPDLGIVPLVNFYFLWSPIKDWMLIVEGDALATGQGRAEDIFGGIGYAVTEGFTIKGGYRLLEGGANVTRNYNFTWVNYASLGVLIHL